MGGLHTCSHLRTLWAAIVYGSTALAHSTMMTLSNYGQTKASQAFEWHRTCTSLLQAGNRHSHNISDDKETQWQQWLKHRFGPMRRFAMRFCPRLNGIRKSLRPT